MIRAEQRDAVRHDRHRSVAELRQGSRHVDSATATRAQVRIPPDFAQRDDHAHLVETANHDKALEECRVPFFRAMGAHRSWEHLQECYMAGSIDRINARIDDLAGAGLQYLVLGPVTDDPKQIDLLAKRVIPNFAK